jgi:hypothetical protein
MPLIAQKVSLSQCKDSGLALVLICLLLAQGTSSGYFLLLGIGLLILTMTAPALLKPFAKFWFGFSHELGIVVSRILLTLLFYIMVTPVGLVRRILGKDSLQLKKFKQGDMSVFKDRDHLITREDLDHPY